MFQQVDEETCRIVVTTQDLSGHPVVAPQTAILLSSEPLPIVEESPAVRDAVDLLPTLTAPQPPVQPQSEIATTTVIEQRSLAQELKGAQELKDSNMNARWESTNMIIALKNDQIKTIFSFILQQKIGGEIF